ncbi:hypothetical protein J7E63_12935 [Bacillus sp. ISL-75]|uniref:YqbF domain-containing protein n=1 Tax=Bacillus sp. ISL-75 TaxID=2819137 RepID=UPI001BEB67F4|nr:YqbF domain-containing protein [Bacillus sp. ISL-75]MBT2727844.1 hypothetical protein [Bacillus sp. ISL-75]
MKKAKLVIGVDYSIGDKTFKKDQPVEINDELFEYLKDHPQFEVYEEEEGKEEKPKKEKKADK